MHSKTYSIPFRRGANPSLGRIVGPLRVEVTLSVPANLPKEAMSMFFGEHVVDRDGNTTDIVNLVGKLGLVQSRDNGQTWNFLPLLNTDDRSFYNCKTLFNGNILVQSRIENEIRRDSNSGSSNVSKCSVFTFGPDRKLLSVFDGADSVWHGTSSVDQSSNGTCMFAEYPDNVAKYRAETGHDENIWKPLMLPTRVFRSKDNGINWEKVFDVPVGEIRHFHTLRADPFIEGHWWLSSGDRAEESKVWHSSDDGDTWQEVSQPSPNIELPLGGKGREQAAFRYTDIAIEENDLIWGSDDFLGAGTKLSSEFSVRERAGSRLYRASKTRFPLELEELGYCGNPVRSMIDVGPAYIITTESKRAMPEMAQVLIVFKDDLKQVIELFKIDNFGGPASGFTYSKASRKAKDGRFYSYRGLADGFNYAKPYFLQWDVKFFDEHK